MAISRPVLLALLGVLLLGATAVAMSGGDEAAESAPSLAGTPAETAPAVTTSQSQPATALAPDQALQGAFAVEDVKSARFAGLLSVEGAAGGRDASVEVTGAFDRGAADELPEFDVTARVRGLDQSGRVGFVSTGDAGYLTADGVGYRVPDAIWGELAESRERAATAAQAPPAGTTGATPPADPAAPATPPATAIDPKSWLGQAKSAPGPQIDGVETTHVTASTTSGAALRDLARLAQTGVPIGAVAAPLGLSGAPGEAVRSASLDVYVGSDRILRRLQFEAVLGRGAGAARGSRIQLELELDEVNDPQTIAAPEPVRAGVPDGALGLFALGLVQGLAGERMSSPAQLRADLSAAANPRKLQRAVKRGDQAVLFLHNPDALDDRATAAAVRELRGTRGLTVLSDRVGNADRYGKLVEDLGVSQASAIVIVDKRGKAHLIEGYVDPRTLAQEVADVR